MPKWGQVTCSCGIVSHWTLYLPGHSRTDSFSPNDLWQKWCRLWRQGQTGNVHIHTFTLENVYYIIYFNKTKSTSCIFESGFSQQATVEFKHVTLTPAWTREKAGCELFGKCLLKCTLQIDVCQNCYYWPFLMLWKYVVNLCGER